MKSFFTIFFLAKWKIRGRVANMYNMEDDDDDDDEGGNESEINMAYFFF